jgi:hypothetical protein
MQRLRERRLPDELRQDLRRIRRDDLRGVFVDDIFQRVHEVADRRGLLAMHTEATGEPTPYLPVVREREILRSFADNATFRRQLRVGIRTALRTAHGAKVDPSTLVRVAGDAAGDEPPHDGTWAPAADIGLQTGTMLDAPPECWLIWAARAAVRLAAVKKRRAPLAAFSVLNPDAGAGGFARALHLEVGDDATGINVQEFDDLFTPTPLPAVVGGRQDALRRGAYDLMVWSVPAPALGGASNDRNRYREVPTTDVGSVGPRRWRQNVERMLRELVPQVLRVGGLAIVRLPLGVRVGERGRRGYECYPGLLDGLLDHLGAAGLSVVWNRATEETGSVNQPYVGVNRCPWLTVGLERVPDRHEDTP